MAKYTVEEMTEKLKSSLGSNLQTVILYGSAAAGDHTGKNSDYNLLVLTNSLDVTDLENVSHSSNKWVKQGNPPPLFFTAERFASSSDVFPIEIADIKDNHKILYGEDPFSDLKISQENLRLELEHELKGKLIQLRERFLETESKPKLVTDLMVNTLSTFLVLFKNALRLYKESPPIKKMEALAELNKHIPFDLEVFSIIEKVKKGEKFKDLEPLDIFKRYLSSVEKVVDGIDTYIHKN